MILMNGNNRNPYTKNFNSNTSYNSKSNEQHMYYNNYIDKNKFNTDYWKLRYDNEKENERFYLIQKQNLSEVKNLIDQSVKLYNNARYNMYGDYIKQEENKNKLRIVYMKKRDKEYLNKEIMDKEIDLYDKKNKEKEFRKIYLNQRKEDEEKEQKIIDNQIDIFKKQKEWEMKNYEHLNKVENIYLKKHNLAVNEYFNILKKDIKRNKRFDEIKKNLDFKNKIENEKRDLYLANYKNRNKDIEKSMREKFAKRYNHIHQFAEEQKELKNNVIENQKKDRDEKIEKNIFLKQVDEDLKKERRNRLLEQFEINEEKVQRRKNLNEKMNESVKFNNYMKHDNITANYIEQKNILIYKNLLKVDNMKRKNKQIEEKIKERQLSGKLRMERYNILKVKKEQMINHVHKILSERKEHNVQDLYKRIFTNEEMKLLKENENL